MADLLRPIKTAGTRTYAEEYALGQQYAKDIEVDNDFDTIYRAWNTEVPPGIALAGLPPVGPAGGSLTGEYPNPTIGPGQVQKTMLDAQVFALLPPDVTIPTDVGKVAIVQANGSLAWSLPPGGPPSGTAGGALAGIYPNPTLAPGAVTDASVTSIGWGKITGAPTSFPPSGTAGGDLSGTYPSPTLRTVGCRLAIMGVPGLNLGNNVETTLVWDTEVFDRGNCWASGANVLLPVTGIYMILAAVHWVTTTATGQRSLWIKNKAGTYLATSTNPGSNATDKQTVVTYYVATDPTDYITITAQHGAGSTMSAIACSDQQLQGCPIVVVWRVGP